MKTPTCRGPNGQRELTKNLIVTRAALLAATATIQGVQMLLARCVDKRDKGHEAIVVDHTIAFPNAEVRDRAQLYAQPPDG